MQSAIYQEQITAVTDAENDNREARRIDGGVDANRVDVRADDSIPVAVQGVASRRFGGVADVPDRLGVAAGVGVYRPLL